MPTFKMAQSKYKMTVLSGQVPLVQPSVFGTHKLSSHELASSGIAPVFLYSKVTSHEEILRLFRQTFIYQQRLIIVL